VLFAIPHTPSPVPRQSANNSTRTSDHVQGQTKLGKTPLTQGQRPVNPNLASGDDAKRSEQAPDNAERPISVSKLPSVTVTKDWTDRAYWAFSGLLVLVGGLQTLLLFGTLTTIRRQARSMRYQTTIFRDNAASAKASVEALINSERAWVLIDIGKIPNFQPDPNSVQFLWVSPTIQNQGKTPARIIRLIARVQLTPEGQALPPKPEYPPGQGFALSINTVLPPKVPIQLTPLAISGDEFIRVREGKLSLRIHGFVDYLDFVNTERHSGFCYIYWTQAGFSPVETGFYVDFTAPPAYTECT
jgi:hypothetical protein